MHVLAKFLHPWFWVGVTIVFHFVAMFREMFQWRAMADGLMGFSHELADKTQAIAANQGLYNSFLAIGLLLTFTPLLNADQKSALRVFLLVCAVAAGIFGTLTISHPGDPEIPTVAIFAAQWVPPLLALVGMRLRRR